MPRYLLTTCGFAEGLDGGATFPNNYEIREFAQVSELLAFIEVNERKWKKLRHNYERSRERYRSGTHSALDSLVLGLENPDWLRGVVEVRELGEDVQALLKDTLAQARIEGEKDSELAWQRAAVELHERLEAMRKRKEVEERALYAELKAKFEGA